MRRQAIAVGAAGFAASAVLMILALAGIERTPLSFLAALAWLAGSAAALAALLQGQNTALRRQDEIIRRLERLPRDPEFERRMDAAIEATEPTIRSAVSEANEALLWSVDARMVGLAEQFLERGAEDSDDQAI